MRIQSHHSTLPFYSTLIFLIISINILGYGIFILLKQHPTLFSTFLMQCICSIGCYILLGIGIALPLIFLTMIFVWFQLALLITGNISPHLAKEGFFKVLNTLFTKILCVD